MIHGVSRYLKSDSAIAVTKLIEQLPYLDFTETIDLYRDIHPTLDQYGKAILGLNDRFYLLAFLLHRPDIIQPWLFERCREVEADPDNHLDLWARYHYKSTIGTFAGAIQEVLRNPEIKIAILSCTNDVAEPFLTQIQQEFENNTELQEVYPDVLWTHPRKQSPLWSKNHGLIVKRFGNPKEATIEAFGLVDGMRTGRHYDLLIYDDLVTERLVTTPEMINKVTERWELSDNLGTHEGTRKWHFGTRYSFADSYGVLLERKVLIERIHPATMDGTLTGEPVFLSEKRWEEVKNAQRSTIYAQMLLNPVSGSEAIFQTDWLQGYLTYPAYMNIYIVVDPSKGRSATSDRTAIAVIGIDTGGNKYLLDGVRHRMRLSDRWDFLKQFYKKWSNHPGVQSVRVGYEVYGMQTDCEVIRENMVREKMSFPLEELNWTNNSIGQGKINRVERLEPDFRRGRWYLPGIVYHPDMGGREHQAYWEAKGGKVEYRAYMGEPREWRALDATGQGFRKVRMVRKLDEDRNVYDLVRSFFEEYRFFPFSPKDDLIDAVSRIYDEKMKPTPAVAFEDRSTDQIVHPDS